MGLFSLEKTRLYGDLTAPSSISRGLYVTGEGPCIRNWSYRTRSNGYKLKEGKFRLDIRKTFLTVRVVRYWNRLPREVVGFPNLAVFKDRLDKVLSNLI